MKVVIVAAGLATRLKPLTNFIPKLLVNIGKETGLNALVNYWKKYTNDFTIIVHSQYRQLVQAYWDLYYKDSGYTLRLVTCDEAKGTRRTIIEHTPPELENQDVLFTWCDVIPNEDIPWDNWCNSGYIEDRTVFVGVHGNESRYKLDYRVPSSTERWLGHNSPVTYTITKREKNDGDIVGIYLVKNFSRLKLMQSTADDVVEAWKDHGPFGLIVLKELTDFGDMAKLNAILAKTDGAREFNKLSYHDNGFIFKEARNEQGKPLIRREIEWYSHVQRYETILNITPQVYVPVHSEAAGFFIEKASGTSLFKAWDGLTREGQVDAMKAVMETLGALHSFKAVHDYQIGNWALDTLTEARYKLEKRLLEIEPVISAFGTPKVVNGVNVTDADSAICWLSDQIHNYYKKNTPEYCLIHGDPQFSNMIYGDGKIKLIDPRGYFGAKEFYGIKDYDLAKVLYSLSGYDGFNTSTSFHLSYLDKGRVGFEIPKPEVNFNVREFFPDKITYLWLAVIWIGLAQYIKNNPVKSYAALCHGLYLVARLQDRDLPID